MRKNIRIHNTEKRRVVGLIASVDAECKIFIRKLKRVNNLTPNYPPFYSGIMSGQKTVLAISGIGKTNAAHAATLLIEKLAPALIINFGIGGAYPSSGLRIGDIAVAEKEIYGDEGVLSKKGFSDMKEIGLPLLKEGKKKYFNDFRFDKDFVNKAVYASKRITHHASRITGVQSGRFVTVSTCTGTSKRAFELEKRYQAICENMEGAAIAHICTMYGIQLIEIRGVSNIVEDRDTKKWDIRLGSENCQKAVIGLIKTLGDDL